MADYPIAGDLEKLEGVCVLHGFAFELLERMTENKGRTELELNAQNWRAMELLA